MGFGGAQSEALSQIEEKGQPRQKFVRFRARGGNNCEACISMDKRIFPEDLAPQPPLHPNCTCELEPV
jgi:hypothetical protein